MKKSVKKTKKVESIDEAADKMIRDMIVKVITEQAPDDDRMTYIIRLVRAEMMEILQTDYIKFARARGISEKSIHYKHALKNGLIPVITIAGINIGTLIAFSIITETVFQWPGMGFLFIQAVQFVDIPIMSAYLVFIAFVFVMINFIVDILYYFIDPRIRVKAEAVSG